MNTGTSGPVMIGNWKAFYYGVALANLETVIIRLHQCTRNLLLGFEISAVPVISKNGESVPGFIVSVEHHQEIPAEQTDVFFRLREVLKSEGLIKA